MRNGALPCAPFSTGVLDSGLEAPRRPMTRRLVTKSTIRGKSATRCPARLRVIALTILDDHNGGGDEPKFVPSDESVGLRGCRLLARKSRPASAVQPMARDVESFFSRSAADLQKPCPQ